MSISLSRWILIIALLTVQWGCRWKGNSCDPCFDGCAEPVLTEGCGPGLLRFEEPCLDCPEKPIDEWLDPNHINDYSKIDFVDLSLEHCIDIALKNSKVMRDLGGTVLRSPSTVASVHDPSIVYTDPRFGEEAALSEFDANFFASAFFENNDRVTNNQFFGNAGVLQQDLASYRYGVRKRAATGSQFTASHVTNYDFNNQTGNRFGTPSASWDSFIDLEMRQPLLQGFGTQFNRIAGPNQQIGSYNGVLVARTNTDISMADFQRGVRELLSNVENAYWDLYFAYRDLDAKIAARDEALQTWRNVEARKGADQSAQEADQAREQYFRFEAEVIDALNGRLVDRTATNNGTSGGTFRATGGVRVAERRLRLVIGWQINGDKLVRPADQPTEAAVRFDWNQAVSSATVNRPELRRQRWHVKQRELELLASKNYLMPQLDLIGRYRFRGFGKELIGGGGKFTAANPNPNAIADLLSGDRQEWQLGVEMNTPVGFRRAHSAVRNAELRLARDRAVLHEQKRAVVYGISNAIGDLKRAYEIRLASYNRYLAAKSHLAALNATVNTDLQAPMDLQLEAQRRVVDATIQYYRSQVEYALAVKNVHFEQGTLLEYCNVDLNEASWDGQAYEDANLRDMLRRREINYIKEQKVISRGEAQVGTDGSAHHNAAQYYLHQPTSADQSAPNSQQNPIPESNNVTPDSNGNNSNSTDNSTPPQSENTIQYPSQPISSSLKG